MFRQGHGNALKDSFNQLQRLAGRQGHGYGRHVQTLSSAFDQDLGWCMDDGYLEDAFEDAALRRPVRVDVSCGVSDRNRASPRQRCRRSAQMGSVMDRQQHRTAAKSVALGRDGRRGEIRPHFGWDTSQVTDMSGHFVQTCGGSINAMQRGVSNPGHQRVGHI